MEIRKINFADPDFPFLLKEIPLPPSDIYLRGECPAETRVAIVGTRKATEKGLRAAREFGKALAEAGVPVVSGLALGIDTAAHEGCLLGKGRTLAVLAGGVDEIYPASNYGLAQKILEEGGGILSEYEPGIRPRSHRFLERNRIVSGLCKAVLIIEAPERSGSLATARFALEQNRDIYIYPGPGGHPNYKGSHRLIREGATLVDSPEDLLMDLGLKAQEKPPIERDLGENEKLVLAILINNMHPLSIDEISEKARLSPPAVHEAMTILILSGLAGEEAGGYINVV